MTYEQEISNQQSIISTLKARLKNIKFPARTINWQHQNFRSPRGQVQQRMEVKRQKKRINTEIASSKYKIASLREMILGE